MRESAKRTVSKYIEARQSEFDKIEFSEKAIELSLEDGIGVSGRIDLVRRRDTNEIAIVDLKSTERAQAEELTEAQLHIYALGYRELTGKDADFVETYELDTQTRRPRAVDDDLIANVVGSRKGYRRPCAPIRFLQRQLKPIVAGVTFRACAARPSLSRRQSSKQMSGRLQEFACGKRVPLRQQTLAVSAECCSPTAMISAPILFMSCFERRGRTSAAWGKLGWVPQRCFRAYLSTELTITHWGAPFNEPGRAWRLRHR